MGRIKISLLLLSKPRKSLKMFECLNYVYRRNEGNSCTKFAGAELNGEGGSNYRSKNCQNVMLGNGETVGGFGKTDMKR